VGDRVTIEQVGADGVDRLRELFLALHHHHRDVTDLPLVDDEEAWQARRATYLTLFAEGRARLVVAAIDGEPVGYALVVIQDGANDTFPLAPRYAELYTLSVAANARGRGIGGRLFDAVDAIVAEEGRLPLQIALMAENSAALRFYRRRGLVLGEILLYRFPGGVDAPDSAGRRGSSLAGDSKS
jgi:ribosomal protein S18 acetylase RimI-like enzyme